MSVPIQHRHVEARLNEALDRALATGGLKSGDLTPKEPTHAQRLVQKSIRAPDQDSSAWSGVQAALDRAALGGSKWIQRSGVGTHTLGSPVAIVDTDSLLRAAMDRAASRTVSVVQSQVVENRAFEGSEHGTANTSPGQGPSIRSTNALALAELQSLVASSESEPVSNPKSQSLSPGTGHPGSRRELRSYQLSQISSQQSRPSTASGYTNATDSRDGCFEESEPLEGQLVQEQVGEFLAQEPPTACASEARGCAPDTRVLSSGHSVGAPEGSHARISDPGAGDAGSDRGPPRQPNPIVRFFRSLSQSRDSARSHSPVHRSRSEVARSTDPEARNPGSALDTGSRSLSLQSHDTSKPGV